MIPREARDIYQYNKSNIQQTHCLHDAKQRNTPRIFIEVNNKRMMSTHSTPGLEALATVIRQEDIKRTQIGNDEVKIILFADDDFIHKRPSRLHQETSTADIHFHQSIRLQNQHIKVSSLPI